MEFGLQFFPDVRPEQKSAAQYFDESLRLVDFADEFGYSHVRIVEHYFHHWGGYTPNPIVFLSAAAQRTRHARMVTGAVLPVFNHPLKLAGEIAMLDALSGGRLDIGFARAFLPHEFKAFGIDMDESVARFEEGVEQIRALLEKPVVSSDGRFHSFQNVTSLPRPTQQPRPPFYLAAVGTPQSFARAGQLGYGLMAIPGVGASTAELLRIYRDAWAEAGHPGKPRVMLACFMFCHEDSEEAVRIARGPIERHFQSIYDAMLDFVLGHSSTDYAGYQKMADKIRQETFESQLEHRAAFVGTPEQIIAQLTAFEEEMEGCDEVSLQVNFNDLSYEDAERSVKLFGARVMPHFKQLRLAKGAR
jgi:alkanesulfonate monooxygenase SsuD/methylene tetrahydromethanopterin reductase-like flavin-dependent oxidoreductase (luciferase family)